MSERPRSLFVHLAVAFTLVAALAVAFFAVVMVVVTRNDIAAAGRQQERSTVAAIRVALQSAHGADQSWTPAELRPIFGLAADAGAHVVVLDRAGTVVAAGGADAEASTGATNRISITGSRGPVGAALVRFAASGILPSEERLRTRLVTAAGVVGAVAAAMALVVALLVARRLARPLRGLTRAVRAMESGDWDARVGPLRAASEVTSLASGFDEMADTLARQDRLRESMTADVAHELRTPIAVLQATAEAVLDGVTEPSMDVVRSMHEEILRLGSRVEDLRALTSAETAGLHLKRAPVDVAEVVTNAARALDAEVAAAGLSMAVDARPVIVGGDDRRLFQVVTNLLLNAVKFTPPGGRIAVRVSEEGQGAVIEVLDTGVGVPVSEQGRIFERFWRGEAAMGRPGSGVGLAIVAELVEAHHGSVTVTSNPGGGTRFRVHLPA